MCHRAAEHTHSSNMIGWRHGERLLATDRDSNRSRLELDFNDERPSWAIYQCDIDMAINDYAIRFGDTVGMVMGRMGLISYLS